MKRTLDTIEIYKAVKDSVYEANFILLPDVKKKFNELLKNEKAEMAIDAIKILIENGEIAEKEQLPLCQDCGMVVVFIELGMDLILEGENLEDAINSGVKDAYSDLNLRNSIVGDPIQRKNTGTNTPSFIHTEITDGNGLNLTVYIKGGGSENMTALKMFRPTTDLAEILDFIEETVINAGPNPCPPLFLGIGIGGTADVALVNAKKAVMRGVDSKHPDPYYDKLENEIKERINKSNVGPLGFGGVSTVADVYIKGAATHIATLPVALNLNCHSLRYAKRTL